MNDPNIKESSPLTNLGTIPNPFTLALGATTADNATIETEGLTRPSHCTELEKEMAELLQEYTLKDHEQYAADICAASTSRHTSARPTYN